MSEFSKISPSNYITIQGWMVTELNLKGTELLIFAIIYGFSQDGENEFTGGLTYLCEWTNNSKPTVIKAISNLLAKGYVIKRPEVINGVLFNHYKSSLQGGGKETLPGVKKLNWGGKESLPGGGKETLPNNKYIYNKKDNNMSILRTEFEEIWKLYPRKLGKAKAMKAYFKARTRDNDPAEFEEVKSAVTAYAEENRHTNVQYIKHGSSWFFQECWLDYKKEAQPESGGHNWQR